MAAEWYYKTATNKELGPFTPPRPEEACFGGSHQPKHDGAERHGQTVGCGL